MFENLLWFVDTLRGFDGPGALLMLPMRAGSTPTQALIQRVTEEVEAESGVELDQLINPAKARE